MEEQNNTPQEEGRLTNAQLELQADSQGPTEVKRITYSRLIARRFFRQRSAVIGLIILIIMIIVGIARGRLVVVDSARRGCRVDA